MANLGTLWFGADIDLTALKQKINSGNQSILDALKMNYDPQSYQQMVSKLKTELGKETFEVKLTANTQKIVQNIKDSVKGGSANVSGLDKMNEKILRQQVLVNDLRAIVSKLKADYDMMGGTERKNRWIEAKAELAKEKTALDNLTASRKAYNQATAQSNRSKQEASRIARQLTSDHIRLNTTLAGGIHVSTQLGSALSGLFAVHTARQFLNNVIEIGGQLEKQRISMQAILGDTARANELFENIKNLAVKSPFGVVELDQYSKQLAAYGIEQSELFNMTKRLADISAGAGQDIGRLALALGHVKSATYLTGITLRQFSMNNIPMLKMLADYYSEVEHRAVSTAEVQKRISKRQVSYEDVVEQIRRMTDEGGQFFNMQEKISESLAARFKNLKDSFDIMYGEIAESSIGDMLKGFASGATDLSRNWKQVITVITEAALLFGTYRASLVATSWATNNLNANTIAAALSNGKLSASMIDRYVKTGQITKAQLLQAVSTKKVAVADAELAAATFGVTRAQLENIALSGRYTGMLAQTSLATSRFTVAQLRLLATLRAGDMSFIMRGLTGVRLGFSLLGTAAKTAMVAVKGFMAPLAGFAVLSAVIDAFMESGRKADEASDRMRNMAETANESYKNMSEARDKFKVGGSESMSDDEIQNNITEMVERLKNYSKTAKETFNNAFAIDSEGKSIRSLREQYEILAKAIDNTTESYADFNKMRPMVEHAIEAGNGDKSILDRFFGWMVPKEEMAASLDLEEAVTFYAECLNEASKAEQVFLRNRLDVVSVLQDMGVADAAKMTNEQILSKITEWMTVFPSKFEEFRSRLQGDSDSTFDVVIDKWDKLSIASIAATDRMKKSGEDFYKSAKVFWGDDMQQWPEGWKNVVILAMEEAIKGVKGFETMSEEAQNDIKNIWLAPFKLNLDSSEAQQQVNNLLVELQNLVGADWTVKIGIKGVSSIEDLNSANKAYTDAVKGLQTLHNSKEKLKKEGKQTSETYKKIVDDEKELILQRDNAARIINEYGGDLPTTQKNRTTGSSSKTDKELEQLKTRLDNVRKFYAEYKKYLELYKDSGKAQSLTEELFGMKPGEGDRIVNNYKGILEEIRNVILSKDSELRKKEGLSVSMLIGDIDREEDKKKIDNAISELQEYITRQSEKYGLYKSIIEKTGNKEFAQSAFTDGKIWDDLSQRFADNLKARIEEKGISVSMDSLWDLSDTKAKEALKDIDGAYDLWKKIVEIIRGNYTTALEESANAQNKVRTNAEKIADLEEKIKKAREDTSGIDHTAEISLWEDEINKLKSELFELLPIYDKIFGNRHFASYKALDKAQKSAKELVKNAKVGKINEKTGKAEYFKSYYMDGNEMKSVILTRQQIERLKNTIEEYDKAKIDKNKFKAFAKFAKDLRDKKKNGNPITDEDRNKMLESLIGVTSEVVNMTEKFGELFEIIGEDQWAGVAKGIGQVADVIGNVAQGFGQGGWIGAVVALVGSIIDLAANASKAQDESVNWNINYIEGFNKQREGLQKQIEKELERNLGSIYDLQVRVKIPEKMYTHGGMGFLENKDITDETIEAFKNAQRTKSYYDATYASLLEQKDLLEAQLEHEERRKDKDKAKIEDYKNQIEEVKDQIHYFAIDMAKELYDIDFKSWAEQLASALVDAWEKGENAADAYKKKVSEILKNLGVKMIAERFIAKALNPIMERFINQYESDSGVMTEQGMAILSEMYDASEQLAEQTNDFMDGINEISKKHGIDMTSSSESSSSISSGIKSITENTADLLGSYINAIRADVSVIRIQEAVSLPAITEAVQRTNVLAETQVSLQQQIAQNTLRNADAADKIYDLLHKVAPDGTKFRVA